ncbi:unnamed protein product [Linum tenue]|uniref:Uncharacterized protein n=1 Tax=Linum tenue TaxID=586396 RepID=A0AAV0PXR5_9ROSI|nr:unnamed protein product [Linum tenue]
MITTPTSFFPYKLFSFVLFKNELHGGCHGEVDVAASAVICLGCPLQLYQCHYMMLDGEVRG